MLRTILTIVQVISALSIIGLVLLQRGKGADAGAGFGAGASGTVFGARGATTGLSRMTAIFAAVFMINSLWLTYSFQRQVQTAPKSLLEQAQEGAGAALPAPAVPATVPAPAPDANAVPTPAAQPEQGPEKP
jgi:preprotein translocase subunit SecG